MPATALIQFTQGTVVGNPGEAFAGALGPTLTVTNDNNTGVMSWQIDLAYTPPGSSITVGTVAFNNTSSTPTATILPDIHGPYRFVLKVWDAINRVGTPTDIDIRVFSIPDGHGLIIPPYQGDPNPRPTLASGNPSAKPNELNFGGQEAGWDGSGTPGLLHDFLQRVGRSNFDLNRYVSTAPGQVLTSVGGGVANYNVPFGSIEFGDSVWFVSTGLANPFSGAYRLTRVSKREQVITESFDIIPGDPLAIGFFLVTSGTQLWVVSSHTDNATYYDTAIREVVVGPPGTSTVGPVVVTVPSATNNIPTGVVWDAVNNRIWMTTYGSTPGGILYGISPSTLMPTTSVVVGVGDQISAPVLDTVTTHYGTPGQRLYVLDTTTGDFIRYNNLGGTPAVDGAPIATGIVGGTAPVAIGGGGAGLGLGRLYAADSTTGFIAWWQTDGTLGGTATTGFAITGMVHEPVSDNLFMTHRVGSEVVVEGMFPPVMAFGPRVLLPPLLDSVALELALPPLLTTDGLWVVSPAFDLAYSSQDPAGHAYLVPWAGGVTGTIQAGLYKPLVTPPDRSDFQFPNVIRWRHDTAGDVRTWQDVMQVVSQKTTPVTILLNDTSAVYGIPPDALLPTTYDMRGARFVAPDGPNTAITVLIGRFAQLQDLGGISGGMQLQHDHRTADGVGPALTFSASTSFRVDRGAAISGLITAEEAMVNNFSALTLEFNDLGTALFIPTTPAVGTVYAPFASDLNIVTTSGGLGKDSIQNMGWLASHASATVRWTHDGSMAFPPNLFTSYHPNNAGTNINQALGLIGGVGGTAHRPVFQGGGDPSVGCLYLDTYFGPGGDSSGLWWYWTGAGGWQPVDGPVTYHAPSLTGDTDNYTPQKLRDTLYISSTLDVDLTGLILPDLVGPENRQYRVFVINEGTFAITLKHNNAGSSDFNRFWIPGTADFILVPNGGVWLEYDPAILRWRVLATTIAPTTQPIFHGEGIADTTSYTRLAAFPLTTADDLDATVYTVSYLLETTDAGTPIYADARIWNVTDSLAVPTTAVTGVVSSLTPSLITVSPSKADWDAASFTKIYELQIKMSVAGTPTDRVTCTYCALTRSA